MSRILIMYLHVLVDRVIKFFSQGWFFTRNQFPLPLTKTLSKISTKSWKVLELLIFMFRRHQNNMHQTKIRVVQKKNSNIAYRFSKKLNGRKSCIDGKQNVGIPIWRNFVHSKMRTTSFYAILISPSRVPTRGRSL